MSIATLAASAGAYLGFDNNHVYRNVLLRDKPVRLYVLDDLDNIARDSSGNNGPSGTYGSSVIKTTTITPSDYISPCIQFPDAANNSAYDPNAIITFPNDPAINFSGGSFSFEFIYNYPYTGSPTSSLGQECSFLNIQDDTGLRIAHPPGNSQLVIYINGVEVASAIQDLFGYNQAGHHIFSYDANSQLLYVYIDGLLLQTVAAAPGAFNSNIGLRIGQRGGFSQPAQNSSFQYIVIYNYALNQAQVTDHANAAGINDYSYTGGGSLGRSASASANVGYDNNHAYRNAVLGDMPLRLYTLGDYDSIARDSSGNNGAPGTYGTSIMRIPTLCPTDYVTPAIRIPNAANSTPDPNANISFPKESALAFNGTSFSIDMIFAFNITNAGSYNGEEQTLLNLGDDTGLRLAMRVNTGSQIYAYYGGASTLLPFPIASYMQPNYLAFVYDAPTKTISFYVNGILFGSGVTSSPADFSSSVGLILGERGMPPEPAPPVSLQYVAIYGYALSNAMVSMHAKAAGITVNPYSGGGGSVPRSISAQSSVFSPPIMGAASCVLAMGSTTIRAASNIPLAGMGQINAAAHAYITARSVGFAGAAALILGKGIKTLGALGHISAKASNGVLAYAHISVMRKQTLAATAHIQQQLFPIMHADAAISQVAMPVLVANARISISVKQVLGASSEIAHAAQGQLNASSRIAAFAYAKIGAHVDILATSMGKTLAASAAVKTKGMVTLAAASSIATTQTLASHAASVVTQNVIGTLNAASAVSESQSLTLAAVSSIVVIGSQALAAAVVVQSQTADLLAASAYVIASVSGSLGAGCYVSVSTDLQASAASYIVQPANDTLAAAATVAPMATQSLGAGAALYRIKYTFAILEALAAVRTRGLARVGAASAIRLNIVPRVLAAGAYIDTVASPVLSAASYVVQPASVTVNAGARVGRVSQGIGNRELIVTPYYGS